MGPLVSAAHRDKVKGYIDLGVKEGAELVVDGRDVRLQGYEDGFFLGGSLFDQVRPEMRIYREEIFGPVLCGGARARISMTRSTSSTTMNSATARRFLPATATRRALSSAA